MFEFVEKRMFVVLIIVACIIPSGSMGQQSLPPEIIAYADMVLYNGKVLTVDENFTIVQAVAVRDGKILTVGSSDRILQMAGPNTTRIDLEGNTLIPGFIDVHAGRFFLGGHGPGGPSYLPNHSRVRFEDLDDGLRKIKGAVEKADAGEWVFVRAQRTVAAYQLTGQMLDAVAPNNPLLVNLDNTTGFVNRKGMSYLPDDVKTGIYKDRNGEPTGRIAGWAYGVLTYEILPWPEQEALEKMIQNQKEIFKKVNAMGITSIGTSGSGLLITIQRELYMRGELPLRIRLTSEMARQNPNTERYLKRVGNFMDVGDEWFKIAGMVVSSIDGTIGSAGFLTREPKRNMEPWDAMGFYGQNKWREMAEEGKDWREYSDYKNAVLAGKYGWNVTEIHSQGDQAMSLLLEVFDEINKVRPIKGKRFGIVHGSMRPSDLAKKFAAYDAMISHNASYLFYGDDVVALEKMYGPDRVAGMQPVRDLIDMGFKPILEVADTELTESREALDEAQGIYLESMEAFITRKNNTIGKIVGPNQRITRQEALKMATAWAARFYGDEDIMGTIEPGKLADLVILGGDYMTVPEEKISELPILKVVVGGKINYEKN